MRDEGGAVRENTFYYIYSTVWGEYSAVYGGHANADCGSSVK